MPRSNLTKRRRSIIAENEHPRLGIGSSILYMLAVIGVIRVSFRSDTVTRQLSMMANNLDTTSILDQIRSRNPGQEHEVNGSTRYQPAAAEAYIMNNTEQLGLANPIPQLAPTCHIWNDPQTTPYHSQLHEYLKELEAYYAKVNQFELPIRDLRKNLTETNHQVCELVKLHPDGLIGMFNKSRQLSWTASGWVEPLMAPMRHAKFCMEGHQRILSMDYLLHDFYQMCLQLKPWSRTIFVDMGASLSFHRQNKSPVLFVLDLYKKFGFKFDHIYAYEMTQQQPDQVFNLLPEEYEAAYHWINVGVASDKKSRQNPLKLILDNYREDDLVVVKLDVDTPVIELPLARQLKEDPQLGKLIDHFYFEHHMNQQELSPYWKRGPHIKETVAESLELFTKIRQQGIASHYWV